MAIRVHLDDVLRARGMTSKELCAKVGITEANLSILRSGKAKGVRFVEFEGAYHELHNEPLAAEKLFETELEFIDEIPSMKA